MNRDMDREKFKKYVEDNFAFLAISDTFSLIDKMCNEFESRCCDNCEHFYKVTVSQTGLCNHDNGMKGILVPDNFCSNFKQIEIVEETEESLVPEIGKTYMLINEGNHGDMMTPGYVYECLEIDYNSECPYTFTSDYGRDTQYSITKKTFENDMVPMTYEEATTKKFN